MHVRQNSAIMFWKLMLVTLWSRSKQILSQFGEATTSHRLAIPSKSGKGVIDLSTSTRRRTSYLKPNRQFEEEEKKRFKCPVKSKCQEKNREEVYKIEK